MLKQIAVVPVILIVLLSVYFGSVSPVQAVVINDGIPDGVFVEATPVNGFTDSIVFSGHGDVNYTTMVIHMDPGQFTVPSPPDGILVARGMFMVASDGGMQYGFPTKWENVTGFPEVAEGGFGYSTGFIMSPERDGRPPMVMHLPRGANVEVNETDGVIFHGSMVFQPHTMLPSRNFTADQFTSEIAEGGTNWHQSDVTEYDTTMKVDLKWASLENKLRLVIYAPDGKVLGPFYDDSDGTVDGRINLEVTNDNGIATGQWVYKVNGIEVAGKEDYYIKTG